MQVTRDDVVNRALTIFDSCGYIWGAWPGTVPTQKCTFSEASQTGVLSASGQYIATDCSGFTSWAWALGYKRGSWEWSKSGEFGKNYRSRANITAYTYEQLFPGIQKGDVLWRQGHVGLYIGGGECLEASSGKWKSTPTGRGMVRSTNTRFNFSGYVSFDGTFSEDYSPSIDINTDNVSDGKLGPLPYITDVSGVEIYVDFHDRQYTKKYDKMKRYRRL